MANQEDDEKQVLLDELADITSKLQGVLDEYQEELKHHDALFIRVAIQGHYDSILDFRGAIKTFKRER